MPDDRPFAAHRGYMGTQPNPDLNDRHRPPEEATMRDPAEKDAPSIEVLREAARLMREEHGPEHERHEMWSALAHLLEREADIEEELSASCIASTTVARAYLKAPRTRPIRVIPPESGQPAVDPQETR